MHKGVKFIFLDKTPWILSTALSLISSPLAANDHPKSLPDKYQVRFEGVNSIQELRSLKQVSSLVQYRKKPPRSLAALRYRAMQDVPEWIKVLHAYSYYDACVETKSFRKPSGQLKMIVDVKKGAPYLLSEFKITPQPKAPIKDPFDFSKVKAEKLGLELHQPARSKEIMSAQKNLSTLLANNGYPLSSIETPGILVDQAQKDVSVNFVVDEGPKAYFGKLDIETEGGVNKRFIQNRVAWKEGELFNLEKILETEKTLYDTGLFSTVTITHADQLNPYGQLPITLEVSDSKFSNLTLGGSYTTTWAGLGGTASWQNRNILKSGVNLKLLYEINQKKQNAGLEFFFPDFLSKKQKLVAQSTVLIQNIMPNYQEKGVNTKIYVERKLSRYFKTSLGAQFDQFETTKSLSNGYFSLFGVPFFFNTQSADNLLINPTSGGWASLNINPFFSLRNPPNRFTFTEVKIEGSVYQYLIPSKRVVLAMNMVFGTIFGSTLLQVPPPYRYFAGSPQHLRGYPYQKISPLNAAGTEIGGRSLFLWSIEPRFMIIKNFQVVGFFDVGDVYLGAWPKWSNALAKSLGVGVRYFSFVGPLTLDIGFPLNRRNNIKRRPQIYFSIGQSF